MLQLKLHLKSSQSQKPPLQKLQQTPQPKLYQAMLPKALTMQALNQAQSSLLTTLPKLRSPWLKLSPSNPKPHHALLWRCAATTDLAKNAPSPRLLAVVAMASPAASLATNQALDVTVSQAAMAVETVLVTAKALLRVAHVWAMRLSAPNVLPWNQPKMRCAAWLPMPMARC